MHFDKPNLLIYKVNCIMHNSRNCRDCRHCKRRKDGLIYCAEDMWLDSQGNSKTLKTSLQNIFQDTMTPIYMRRQAQGCPHFESMTEEEIG